VTRRYLSRAEAVAMTRWHLLPLKH